MVAKMLDLQLPGVYYYENIEGGHGGAADNKQRAFMSTLAYDFLDQTLAGKGVKQGKGGAYEYAPAQEIY